jgi:hypothetical protein
MKTADKHRIASNMHSRRFDLSYRGVYQPVNIFYVDDLKNPEDFSEITRGLLKGDEIKAVFFKNPINNRTEHVIFPAYRGWDKVHHTDFYLSLLEDNRASLIVPEKKITTSDLSYLAVLNWQRILSTHFPGIEKPYSSFAVGFKFDYNPDGSGYFEMGSFITSYQIGENIALDRDLFHESVQWIKESARRAKKGYQENKDSKTLEKLLTPRKNIFRQTFERIFEGC